MISFFKRNYKKIIIILVIILAGSYGVNYVYSQNKQVKKQEFAKVQKGTLAEKLTISGKIDAEEHVILRFQTSGRLAWVGVKEGDRVKKYQSIASLDVRELQKTLQKYLNTYMQERNDFDDTTKDDYKNKAITDPIRRILENAQLDLENSVLDVELKDLALKYAYLNTPIEGLVIKITTPYAGVNITPAGSEFEIVNPETIYFSALADQTEVTKLHEAMAGKLILDSYPDETFTGTIRNISFTPKAGETGTVYEVKLQFNQGNSDYRYKLGMTGDLEFTTSENQDVLYLPVKFVKKNGNGEYVTVEREGKQVKQPVTTGMETDDSIEILSGVSEGETVYE